MVSLFLRRTNLINHVARIELRDQIYFLTSQHNVIFFRGQRPYKTLRYNSIRKMRTNLEAKHICVFEESFNHPLHMLPIGNMWF